MKIYAAYDVIVTIYQLNKLFKLASKMWETMMDGIKEKLENRNKAKKQVVN